MEVEETPEGPAPSTVPEDDGEKDKDELKEYNAASVGDESPIEKDQMAKATCAGPLTVPTSVFVASREIEGLAAVAKETKLGVLPETGAWTSQGFACSLCKRLFSSLEYLREHEYRHTLSLMAMSLDWPSVPSPFARPGRSRFLHFPRSLYGSGAAGPSPTRYLCSQCPASFTLKSNADRHEKTIHFKEKLMQCVYCLKHFRDRTDLHRHLSSVHSKERGHVCPACAKSFSTHKNLATHIKVCCQVGSVPGAMLGGSTGMPQDGDQVPLWRLSEEMKVEISNCSILDVEN